jgi:putative tryptophan/tyrosine transport system substrate-binding protein
MKRREFIGLVGGALVWPLLVRAQEAGRTYRLGFLLPVARQAPAIRAFFDELRLNGFVEGQNLSVVPGGFEVRNEQVVQVAKLLVEASPDAIISGGDVSIRALQQATRTIPILGMGDDMVGAGLVASLARPGGNTTGISLLSPELDGKRQEILMAAVPSARRIAALADSSGTLRQHLPHLQEATRARGIELFIVSAGKSEEIAPAIDAARARGADAVNVLSSPMLFVNRRIILDHVAEVRMPAIYQWPDMANEGALLAYGPRFTQLFRQRARMVAKVLRGAKPADLPVEQPDRFELVMNLKVAKAIGHEFPAELLLRADEVIE